MKKIILSLLLLCAAVGIQAQTDRDACWLIALWGSTFTLHGQTAIGDSVAYKEALIEMIEQSGDLLKFRNATAGFQTMALGKISSEEDEY